MPAQTHSASLELPDGRRLTMTAASVQPDGGVILTVAIDGAEAALDAQDKTTNHALGDWCSVLRSAQQLGISAGLRTTSPNGSAA